MSCSGCGKNVNRGQNYCRSCGSYLATERINCSGSSKLSAIPSSAYSLKSLLIWWSIQITSNIVALPLIRQLEDSGLRILRLISATRVPAYLVIAVIPLTVIVCLALKHVLRGRLALRGSTQKLESANATKKILTRSSSAAG